MIGNSGSMMGPMFNDMAGGVAPGKWFNPRTGQEVYVRDSFIDGENMIVRLGDGSVLTLMEFQDFVQMSDDIYDASGKKIGKASDQPTPIQTNTPSVDASLLFDGMEKPTEDKKQDKLEADDLSECISPVGQQKLEQANNKLKATLEKQLDTAWSTRGEELVEQALKNSKIAIDFNVAIADFPTGDLEVLRRVFEVTTEDITNVIIKKYVNFDTLKDQVDEWVKDAFDK